MNSEELKAAAERLLQMGECCGGSGNPYLNPNVPRMQFDEIMVGEWVLDQLDSAESSPQWRDKPTCAGLWAFPATAQYGSWTVRVNECDLLTSIWQRPCFGPIPERPAT
jgi:hypothetical protein